MKTEFYSKTLEKGLRLLELFDSEHTHWNQKDLSKVMQINTTSIYRLINTFIELGYLSKDAKSKQITLGPMAISLGHRFLKSYSFLNVVDPIILEASKRYNMSIDVSLYARDAMVLVCRHEQRNTLTFHQPASAKELYCTAIGKSYLAFLPENKLEQIMSQQSLSPRTANTVTDRDSLLELLKETRKNGFSVNNEEYIKGLISIGAPLFNPLTEEVVGGVSFDTTTLEMPLTNLIDSFSAVLIDLSKRITNLNPGF